MRIWRRTVCVASLCTNLSNIRSLHVQSFSMTSLPKSVLVVGGGIQGTSVAYHIRKASPTTQVTIIEAKEVASAASGKGGGFMARSWGDGSPTESLHHVAFDMYEQLSLELGCESYRKLPVLCVAPGRDESGLKKALNNGSIQQYMPNWLDGNIGNVRPLGYGDETAQITPKEFVQKMIEKGGLQVILGEVVGVSTSFNEASSSSSSSRDDRIVTGVTYKDRKTNEIHNLQAEVVIVSAGPWSCMAEDWFDDAISLPMEGVKSTSIVWKKGDEKVDATALFCGEDSRFGTHLEVYPRPDGSIYICGIGGSDYISREQLKQGAYREICDANESRVEAATNAFTEMSKLYRTKGQLDRTQACMRPCPPDAIPYMGKIPGYRGAYINAGHNCWGIAWAPACGIAMSELVLNGGSSTIDLRPFDPTRFTIKVKERGRKKRGENVGEQW